MELDDDDELLLELMRQRDDELARLTELKEKKAEIKQKKVTLIKKIVDKGGDPTITVGTISGIYVHYLRTYIKARLSKQRFPNRSELRMDYLHMSREDLLVELCTRGLLAIDGTVLIPPLTRFDLLDAKKIGVATKVAKIHSAKLSMNVVDKNARKRKKRSKDEGLPSDEEMEASDDETSSDESQTTENNSSDDENVKRLTKELDEEEGEEDHEEHKDKAKRYYKKRISHYKVTKPSRKQPSPKRLKAASNSFTPDEKTAIMEALESIRVLAQQVKDQRDELKKKIRASRAFSSKDFAHVGKTVRTIEQRKTDYTKSGLLSGSSSLKNDVTTTHVETTRV